MKRHHVFHTRNMKRMINTKRCRNSYASNLNITGQPTTQDNVRPHTIKLSQSRAKRAHEHTTNYWCFKSTAIIPTLLYQLSLQTNDLQPMYLHLHMYMCNTQPLSHHTRHYWTYWMLEYNYSTSTHTHTPCYELWDSNGICQSRAAQHQHVHYELHDGPWCFQ